MQFFFLFKTRLDPSIYFFSFIFDIPSKIIILNKFSMIIISMFLLSFSRRTAPSDILFWFSLLIEKKVLWFRFVLFELYFYSLIFMSNKAIHFVSILRCISHDFVHYFLLLHSGNICPLCRNYFLIFFFLVSIHCFQLFFYIIFKIIFRNFYFTIFFST